MFKKLKLFILQIIILSAVIFVLFFYILNPFHVKGSSMENTISDNSYIFINVLDYAKDHIERFDIVAVYSQELDESMIKRVIGLPNDHIEYKDDQLYINSVHIEEDFLDKNFIKEIKSLSEKLYFTNDFQIQLKEDEYYVLGDNRLDSIDSRVLGIFHKEDIIGVNGLVIYPFDNFMFLD